MTKLFDKAIEAVNALPDDKQDEVAEAVFRLLNTPEPVHQLTPEEEASFSKSLDQATRREFASEEEVRSVFAKYAS